MILSTGYIKIQWRSIRETNYINPLDRDLSSEYCYPPLDQLRPVDNLSKTGLLVPLTTYMYNAHACVRLLILPGNLLILVCTTPSQLLIIVYTGADPGYVHYYGMT